MVRKYVDIGYEESPRSTDSRALLNTRIRLLNSPRHRLSLSFELTNASGVSKTGGDFLTSGNLGLGTSLTYKNNNLFGGAEAFNIEGSLLFDFPKNVFGSKTNDFYSTFSSFENNISATLDLPSFLLPFVNRLTGQYNRPHTLIGLSAGYIFRNAAVPDYDGNRVDVALERILFNTSFGYSWNHRRYHHHKLTPFNLTYTHMVSGEEYYDYLYLITSDWVRILFQSHNYVLLNTRYEYTYHTYAHLGGFVCPGCGYRRQEPDCALTQILEMTPQGSTGRICLSGGKNTGRRNIEGKCAGERDDREYTLQVGLPAVYNLYNAMAAVCAYTACGFPAQEMIESLKTVHSSFGRMERFTIGRTPLQMILVKNPAGCSQALEYLSSVGTPYRAVLCLNDRTADGHDISWIWDADYEKICRDPNLQEILVCGDRAEDMQLRLKYAGANTDTITLVREPSQALPWIEASQVPVFALPNYTSMLELREAVRQKTGAGEFWE